MGLFPDVEHHEDGSRTERWDNGTSVTINADQSIREVSKTEGWFDELQITRDADGNITNIQERKNE